MTSCSNEIAAREFSFLKNLFLIVISFDFLFAFKKLFLKNMILNPLELVRMAIFSFVESRLILEPTPSNTPTAISAAYSSADSAIRASAAGSTSLVEKIDLTDADQTYPHVVAASTELAGDRGSTAEAIVNSVLSGFDADTASKLADELGQAAASAAPSAQDSVLQELKEAADLPPPEPTAQPTA